jgi:hypothetical protein
MASKKHCVTTTDEEEAFISENNISLTQILHSKLEELRTISHISADQLKEANRKIAVFQELAEAARKFIEKEGLIDKYLTERRC